MDQTKTVTFRPNVDKHEEFQLILQWCEENGSSFNSIINSLIPAIAYALCSEVREDELGARFIRCDFGDVPLQEPGPYLRH